MIQKFKMRIFFTSKSRDHQISKIITMTSRLWWSLMNKCYKLGSRSHGKINHQIVGSYIFIMIMGSYIFMIGHHRINLRASFLIRGGINYKKKRSPYIRGSFSYAISRKFKIRSWLGKEAVTEDYFGTENHRFASDYSLELRSRNKN